MGNIFFIVIVLLVILLYLLGNKNAFYISMFLYLLVPDYCAMSLGDSLPTLTLSRMILVVVTIFTIIREKGKIKFKILNKSGIKLYLALLFFVETALVVSHFNISAQIKDYLGFILENILFLIVFINNIDEEEKLEKMLKYFVVLTGVVSVFSIIEPFTGVNFARFLNTGANTEIIDSSYERLNVIRATFSLGHPICLAVFLSALVPIIIYFINLNRDNKLYKIVLLLDILATILTVSRGPIMIMFVVLFYMFIKMKNKEKNKYIMFIFIAIILLLVAILVSSQIRDLVGNLLISITNELGITDVDVQNLGNKNGTESRLVQWTAVPFVLKKNAIFGGGADYIHREKAYFTFDGGKLWYLSSVDCEYLSIVLNKGLLGIFGWLIFYYGVIKNNSKIKLNDERLKYLKYSYIVMLLCYVTVCQLTTIKIFWVIISCIIVEKYVQAEKSLSNSKEKSIN